jgi:hypothetical protein
MSRTQQAPTQRQPQAAPPVDPNSDLLDEIMEKTISNLDKASEKIVQQLDDPALGSLRRAAITGLGIERMRQMMDGGVMRILRSLMNTELGFLTDRDPRRKKQGESVEPYSDEVVRDCAIAAHLKGVQWVGNHFNIIAGKCYIAQQGWAYKLDQIAGLEFRPIPDVPQSVNGGVIVRYGVKWKLNGKTDQLYDTDGKPGVRFPIKTDTHSTVDAILGKALCKALRLTWYTVRGIKGSSLDDDESDLLVAAAIADAALRVSDRQHADLNAAIAEHDASADLIRVHYQLSSSQRLLAKDYADCMAGIKAGRFGPGPKEVAEEVRRDRAAGEPLAEGEIPNESGDLREYTSDEIEQALVDANLVQKDVYRRFNVKRAPDLTPAQRREIMAELHPSEGI